MMLYQWFSQVEFANKWVLPFLGMLPVLAWMRWRMLATLKSTFTVSTTQTFTVQTFKNQLVHLPFLFRLVAIGCIILALARPQFRNQQQQKTGQGIDIVLCMDISGSMLSADFYPNRLEVAKEVAINFVQSRPVDQIGLVIFSGESYTQVPVSPDHQLLLEQIRNLHSGMLEDGTLIGEGLATSVERLSASKSKSRVVILLTDGKEQPPKNRLIDPSMALEIAKAKKVRVYTIGMNAVPSATILERGAIANNGSLDEVLLKRIAIQTGGQYFRATDKEGLEQIYQQIDRMEKSKVEILSKEKREEKFFPFVVVALFCLALELILRYILLRTFP